MEVTLPYTAVVRQEVGPEDTVVALVSSDVAMTLQASLVVLQKDSYGSRGLTSQGFIPNSSIQGNLDWKYVCLI